MERVDLLETELIEAQRALMLASLERDALINSSSWRATLPLRLARASITTIFQRLMRNTAGSSPLSTIKNAPSSTSSSDVLGTNGASLQVFQTGQSLSAVNNLSYTDYFHRVSLARDVAAAAAHAIGGHFEAFGILEREMLRFYGLKPDAYLIDIGCGSGRLAIPLSEYLQGTYLGIDVVPGLVDFARNAVNREDWRFEIVTSFKIPETDKVADMVCFFSVSTHLLHEQTYLYLEEARRVLKPGGKIVLSFLEYDESKLSDVFLSMVAQLKAGSAGRPMNMFIDRAGLRSFARHLDLVIDDIRDAHDRFVPLSQPITLDGGSVMQELGTLGQSICVMTKR